MGDKLSLPKQLELPEAKLPLEYSVPFDWGNLHVTQSANDAYGIQPLSSDTIDGGSFKHLHDEKPQIDIFVTGPDEFPAGTSQGNLYSASMVYKNGIGVAVGSFDTATNMEHMVTSHLEDFVKQVSEGEMDLSTATDDDGVPIGETLRNDVPQMIAHILANLAGAETANALSNWHESTRHQNVYRGIVLTGAAAIAGSVIVASPAIISRGGDIDPANLIVPGIYLTTYLNIARLRLRRFLSTDSLTHKKEVQYSQFVGAMVAQSIHNTYCRIHFDQQAEQLLEEKPETDNND